MLQAHGRVELAVPHQQAGEQVEPAEPLEVAHRGAAAVANLDQLGLGQPLQRLADRWPGNAQHLGEPPFAGQGVTGSQLSVDHLTEQLVEDVLGDQATGYRFQGHAASMPGHSSGGQVVRPIGSPMKEGPGRAPGPFHSSYVSAWC